MIFEPKEIERLSEMIAQKIELKSIKRERKEFETKIFNIRQTAQILKKSYNFVKKLIDNGYLIPTKDGRHISGKEIYNYLNFPENEKAVSNGNNETA